MCYGKSVSRRAAVVCAALVLIAGALAGRSRAGEATDSVPEIPPPKSWDSFVILQWQFQTDAVKDKALYESVNLHGFHIDRRDDRLQAFAKETNWPFYVDHTAGKGYLHLGRFMDQVKRKKDITVRPNSLVDPKTIEAMKKLITENVTSAKGSSVVAYALDDEISLGAFCSPCEVDGHPESVAGYRKCLAETYKTIETLNAEYGTAYKSFDEIAPKSYEAFRAQLKPDAIGTINLSQWCDWRGYMDTQFADCVAAMVRFANSLDPNTPAGFVGGQSPAAYGGYDYRKLCKAAQWMEAYDIGGSNEVLRSFWTAHRPHVQTFFSSKDPKKDAWFLWYYLVHGNRGVISWPEGWFVNGQVAAHIKALAATFKEVQGPVSKAIIDGEFIADPVAIYYSHPSIQVTWAMDAACHGGTWPNRSSSMDNSCSTSANSRIGWLKTLEDIGIQAKVIHRDHLLAGELDKSGCKVLFLNRALCLSDAEADAIKSFAAKGGTVIADHLCGIYDEHGKARATGALDDLFGVKHDLSKGILGGKTLTEINGEKDYSGVTTKSWDAAGAATYKDVAVFEPGLRADKGKAEAEPGGAVVVRNGTAVYLNLSPIGYLLKRPANEAKEWLPFVAGLLKQAGVEPRLKLEVRGQPAHATEPLFWKNGERMTLCVVRNLDRKASISGFGTAKEGMGEGNVKLKLLFAKPVKALKNERTGKDLGDGKEFEDEFTPWEANVYTYTQ
ncbi:MAG: beta-galactosidase trimerization domain-containing protein [Planctomycetota bacterium]|nr:beta-galactosidase trimerization domain-containing protein [Planctomycetota bacterium]